MQPVKSIVSEENIFTLASDAFKNLAQDESLVRTQRIDSKWVRKKNPNNAWISDISEIELPYAAALDENKSIRAYYTYVVPNYSCEFLCEHAYDHYSVAMVNEAIIQFTLATAHQFMDYSFDFKHLLKELRLDVADFMDYDLPLFIGYIDTTMKRSANYCEREAHCFVYQSGRLHAEAFALGSLMTSNLYDRSRYISRRKNLNVKKKEDVSLVTCTEMLEREKQQTKLELNHD